MVVKMNAGHRVIYQHDIARATANNDGVCFIDGPGGNGKSSLENFILKKLRCEGHIALAAASSGIAALSMDGGQTAHFRLKTPLQITEGTMLSVTHKSQPRFRQTRLIISDDARKSCFETVDRSLHDLTGNDVLAFLVSFLYSAFEVTWAISSISR